MQYNDELRGRLFGNSYKNVQDPNDKSPNFKGRCVINGVEWALAAWWAWPQNGGEPYLQLKFEPPRQPQAQPGQMPQGQMPPMPQARPYQMPQAQGAQVPQQAVPQMPQAAARQTPRPAPQAATDTAAAPADGLPSTYGDLPF